MKKMIFIGMTLMAGVSAPLFTYAQSKDAKLTQIIESTNRNHIRMRYFREKATKLIVTRSDADILSDGDIAKVPKEKRINDVHRQNQLFAGIKLNPYVVNYTVIPDELSHRETLKNNGVKMRSLYFVYDIQTKKSSFGIVADIGPGGQITNGEFSVHQILELGLNVDKKTGTGGKDANDIITIIFPNSDEVISLDEIKRFIDNGVQGALQWRIDEEGLKLFKKYAETYKFKDLEQVIRAIKNETVSVTNFD